MEARALGSLLELVRSGRVGELLTALAGVVLEIATGFELQMLTTRGNEPRTRALNGDGRTLVGGNIDGRIMVWRRE